MAAREIVGNSRCCKARSATAAWDRFVLQVVACKLGGEIRRRQMIGGCLVDGPKQVRAGPGEFARRKTVPVDALEFLGEGAKAAETLLALTSAI